MSRTPPRPTMATQATVRSCLPRTGVSVFLRATTSPTCPISKKMSTSRTGCAQRAFPALPNYMGEMMPIPCSRELTRLSLAQVRSQYPIFCSPLTVIPDFPVLSYRGTKSFVISTVSWIGGKNPFLGWAYVASSALFILIAIFGTARHLIKPR